MSISYIVLYIVLSFCITALLSYGFTIYASVVFFQKRRPINFTFQPPISILKPLCGLDSDTYANLASFCRQNYSRYQIIFGVREWTDCVIPIAKQIIKDFPEIDIRLVVDDRVIGNNLKVSNLANLLPHASYDLILISDSDICVDPNYLLHTVQPMQRPGTGVVTCLYRSKVYTPIATLEALSISTDFHASVLMAQQLGWMKFAMGSSILIRAAVLKEIGGFEAIANHLADDFMLGNLPAQAGYRVVLSDYVVEHGLDTKSILDFIQHQTRWNRCTRVSNPWGYLGLLLGQGTVTSLLFCLLSHGSALGWAVLLTVWAARLFVGWLVGAKYLQDQVATRFLWLVPLRDLMSFGLWSYGWMGNCIAWRGNQFRLRKGGTLQLLEAPEPTLVHATVTKNAEIYSNF